MCMTFTSCTYSINMIHSKGSTDTLDEQQTSNPNISPTITAPVIPGAL